LQRLTLPRRLPDAMRVGKDLSELIYAASANDGEPSSRLAEEAARRIEDDIASSGFLPGCSLGSLRVLSERYRVGRAVIREALGLLERRGLGKMRPGPCGGFILTKPRCDGVARELAQHFRTSGITLQQLLDAREAVDLMVVRMALAARSRNPIPPGSSAESPATEPDPLAARLQLAQGAGEPTLVVLVECLNQLTLDFLPASAAQWVGLEARHAMSDVRLAVQRGDLPAAMVAAEGAHQELMACMSELKQSTDRLSDPSSAGGALAGNIAGQLAAQILGGGSAGMRLGSEWDLCERFGVSRLTLRRAIRLLQDSGLVECRRGRGNGLIARDRRAPGSIRLLLAYLIGEKLDPMSAGTMLLQLNCFTPALAVARAGEDEKHKLQAALETIESDESVDRYDLLRLVQRVSRLADSPVIDLISRSLAAYEARFRATLPERLPASAHASYFQLLRRLLERVTGGTAADLSWAKQQSGQLLVQMSFSRPI